jgi:ATP adenylyltransferase
MEHLWTPWRMSYLRRTPSNEPTCIFCSKVEEDNDPKNHILYRGKHCFVILNLYPYNNGHLMVVPYQHTSKLEEIEETALAELMTLTQKAVEILTAAYNPQGFNIGINLGTAAGAGIATHIHQHVVPRWNGDTNFVSIVGQTRIIPEWIDETYVQLRDRWERVARP